MMTEIRIGKGILKQTLKDALVEVLEERRDLLRDVIEEVLDEYELVEDPREVRRSDRRARSSVFAVREGEA